MSISLTDVSNFTFTPIGSSSSLNLMGNLISWNDSFHMRLALHQYLKTDGAEVEPMGAAPAKFSMKICFMGPDWAKQYLQLVGTIRQEPRGTIAHPIFGNINVGCEGIREAQVTPGQMLDTIEIGISFVEDQLNRRIAFENILTPAQQGGKISTLLATLTGVLSKISGAIALASTLGTLATEFVAACIVVSQSNTPDPSLDTKLAGVNTASDATRTAILAGSSAAAATSPTAPTDAASFVALSTVEQIRSTCIAMNQALAASRPALIYYVVQAQTNVATLAAMLYGSDGMNKISELLLLNRISNAHKITAGTVLHVSSPTLTVGISA